jgi:salicylate 5-hydroxylase large subunit
MSEQQRIPLEPVWDQEDTSRIPFRAYTDESLYRQELDKLFYSKHWCYIGLEAEIPEAGDFKRTVIGERSVIMARNANGAHITSGITTCKVICKGFRSAVA